MAVVWKFPLEIEGGPQAVKMPPEAELLCVQEQSSVLCLWARVKPEGAKGYVSVRRFQVFGTGHENVPESACYVGMVQQMGGALVWHVFEVF